MSIYTHQPFGAIYSKNIYNGLLSTTNIKYLDAQITKELYKRGFKPRNNGGIMNMETLSMYVNDELERYEADLKINVHNNHNDMKIQFMASNIPSRFLSTKHFESPYQMGFKKFKNLINARVIKRLTTEIHSDKLYVKTLDSWKKAKDRAQYPRSHLHTTRFKPPLILQRCDLPPYFLHTKYPKYPMNKEHSYKKKYQYHTY
jgi:hypothetical protein